MCADRVLAIINVPQLNGAAALIGHSYSEAHVGLPGGQGVLVFSPYGPLLVTPKRRCHDHLVRQ